MHHVHTRTVTSTVTTKEPISSLSPAVLFPFFQPPTTISSSSSSSPPFSSSSSPPAVPPSASTHSVDSTTSTSTTDDSSCACHSLGSLPTPAIASSTFLTLPSANSHQPLVIPLLQPPAPPSLCSPPTSASSHSVDTANATHPSNQPLMLFSHGSTQVDTFVPSIGRLQRTLYSWSQLSDYTPKHCWELPATSSSQSSETETEGKPGAHNISIANSVGRICQGEEVSKCPGHPWVNFSYHMQVKQWQQAVEGDMAVSAAVPAVATEQVSRPCCSEERSFGHRANVAVKGVSVQLAAPCGELRRRRRLSHMSTHRSRHTSPSNSSSDGRSRSGSDGGSEEAGIASFGSLDGDYRMDDSPDDDVYDASVDGSDTDDTK